ncbi:fumarylacetoacetate hydrolase family protein [Nostocoides vanveenii]|uniref:Fumarylacetoacetate hydrolase family protein n=2 Tax=Nostocoides vanveenii TaxID=330835 RepID=A0ABN2KU25_9MICO
MLDGTATPSLVAGHQLFDSGEVRHFPGGPVRRGEANRMHTPTLSLRRAAPVTGEPARLRLTLMRIVRFTTGEDPAYGVLEEDGGVIAEIVGDPLYQGVTFTGRRVPADAVRLLAPVIPRSKVIGIGRNYADHAKEMGNDIPTSPLVFLVPNTAVVGPDDPVIIPSITQEVSYEGELAVVIGRIAKSVPKERANEVIFGYTCANDVTARDLQRGDGQWARAKGMDTFCPLGPAIATDLDVSDLRLVTRVDGEVKQDGTTADLIFDIPTLIAYLTQAFTLLPGDVILTGTPAGVGTVDQGSRVEVEIDGIGILANPFLRRD